MLTSLAALGCREDAIRTYTVPPLAAGTDEAGGEDRMLAAIVPGGGQAWFFKLVGPADEVETVSGKVGELFASITVDDADGKPNWQAPKGWDDAGPSGMRLTTLRSPNGLELTVTGLSADDDWQAGLLSNVNRWRGQLGLASITAGQLTQEAQRLEAAGDGAIAVDLVGKFKSGGMSPPFAGGGFGAPPASPPAARQRPKPIAFDTPEGWIEKPASSMRLATLMTGGGEAAAEAVASVFPAVPGMVEIEGNVNRWRGQVGLSQVTGEALGEATETIEIAGAEATYTEAIGEKSAIFAAMQQRGDQVYFFKLTAKDVAEAVANRDAYKAWIESVRFVGDGDQDPGEGE
ncbi:MAG: hypothetical protein AAGJ46_07360 [Planctomycetota bacterium]